MRGYLAMTAQEVAEFQLSGIFDASDIYAPTSQFIVDHTDLNDEEIEYTLSMVAAEDALEMKAAGTGTPCVLAFEVPANLVSESHDMSISLSAPLKWENLECIFTVSSDGEELTWFATQEIESHLSEWLK